MRSSSFLLRQLLWLCLLAQPVMGQNIFKQDNPPAPPINTTTLASNVTAGNDTTVSPILPVEGNETVAPSGNATITPTPTVDPSGTNNDTNATLPLDSLPPNVTVAPTENTNNQTNITIAPTASPSVPDTDQSVYMTWEYGFENGTARAPTEAEIEDLMCQTNLYIRDRVRNATQNDTVQVTGMHINWLYTGDADADAANPQPITLQFLANATYDNGEPVPTQTVTDAMPSETDDFLLYLENYVMNVATDNIFMNADSARLEGADAGSPVPPGMLESATCPETDAPSAAPSVSAGPSVSATPSQAPSFSAAPTLSMSPSLAPSLSQAPTIVSSSAPSTLATVAPVVTPVTPTAAIIPDSGDSLQTINAMFVVSNLEGIVEPAQVNSSGLQAAWPSFVQEVVADTLTFRAGNQRRQLRETHDTHRRRLTVALEAGPEHIYKIVQVTCPTNNGPVHEDLICHNAFGTYTLVVQDSENAALVEKEFGDATVNAIMDGELDKKIKEITPSTPLFVGTVAPPSDGGMPVWLLILIILLCILVCICCIAAALFFVNKNKQQENDDGDDKAGPYEEEGFAYDFLIPVDQKPQTEVDDDDANEAGPKGVDVFEDEEAPMVLSSLQEDEPAVVEEEEGDVEEFEDESQDEEEDSEEEETKVEPEEEELDAESEEEENDGEEAEEEDDSDGETPEEEDDSDDETPRPEPSQEFGDQDEPSGIRGSVAPDYDSGSGSDPSLVEVDNDMEASADFGASGGTEDWDDENDRDGKAEK